MPAAAGAPNRGQPPGAWAGSGQREPLAESPALARVVAFFEGLQPADLDRMATIYAPGACFKDPFNEVVGVEAVRGVFAHMFQSLHNPRFVVTRVLGQGSHAFLTWEFRFRFQRHSPQQEQCILGATHLVLDEQGRIAVHRDYWDAAEELYEKLPVLGALMRWLKRRASQ